jgi:hypothetical protein
MQRIYIAEKMIGGKLKTMKAVLDLSIASYFKAS